MLRSCRISRETFGIPKGGFPNITRSVANDNGLKQEPFAYRGPSRADCNPSLARWARHLLSFFYLHMFVAYLLFTTSAMMLDMACNRLMLTVLLVLAAFTIATPTQRHGEVDYVIVGAGPAGFVLAEYLTRKLDVKVVLLEAGPDSSADPLVTSKSLDYTTVTGRSLLIVVQRPLISSTPRSTTGSTCRSPIPTSTAKDQT